MLPAVGCGTRSAYRRTHLLHRRRSRSLSLSQVWRTNEGHRTAHRCRNPASFSTTDQLCGMKLLSPTPTLPALRPCPPRRKTNFSLQPLQQQFSQHGFTVAIFWARGVMSHAPRRSFGTPQNRPFPPLNLHRARVHRNHGRPRPNGFTGRAQSSPPPFTPYRERASGKALAFIGTNAEVLLPLCPSSDHYPSYFPLQYLTTLLHGGAA